MRYVHSFHRWLLLGLFSIILASSASAQGIAVQLDGRNLYFDQPPAMIDGRLLVPLRGIFEALSADVLYEPSNRTIKATKGSTVVQLQLGSQVASINGRNVYLDVPADSVGGRTMVPLRFVSESLGADVKWNGATKTVVINNAVGDVASVDDNLPPGPPMTAPVAAAPDIDRVVHNGASALNPGDNLEVVVYGDPGARATFELLGQTQEINLPEVSPGRYQATYPIPVGMQNQRAVLMAHLRDNGQETTQEADRPVTIRVRNWNDNDVSYNNPIYNNPNYNNSFAIQDLQPNNGAVTNSRPTIGATFNQNVSNVSLVVDNTNVTNQAGAQRYPNGISWTPRYNLTNGLHRATVTGVDQYNRQFTQSWDFTVGYNPNIPGGGTGQLYVSNLNNGSVVPPVFNVQGSAQPGQQVTALIEYSPNNILEVITGQTRQISRSMTVGANGRFDIPMDASAIRSRQTFRLTVTDGYGPGQVLTLRRQ